MKILLSAFACDPGQGSEAGVGWGIASALAQTHRVHVLTTPRHRVAIEEALAKDPRKNLSFSYFDFPAVVLRLLINSSLWQVYYHAWQHRIGFWAAGVAAEFQPDIVHHVTYGRYWTPSTLWRLNRPFVWGPLGGGDFCPAPFLSTLSRRERFTEKIRALAQRIAHWDPQLRATARHADVALASTPATRSRLEGLGCLRVKLLLQMALDSGFLHQPIPFVSGPTTFCSVGRLLGWKGHSLTLCAFAKAAVPGARLLIIGEGPAKKRLLALADSLGLGASVAFIGGVPRREALSHLAAATALVHPSLHDQAPTVVFEAMAMGTPVLALDLGGLPLQIDTTTGFLIPAKNPAQAIAEMAEAMRQLAGDKTLRQRMGEAGRQRMARYFTWEKKAEEFEMIYRAVLVEKSKADLSLLGSR